MTNKALAAALITLLVVVAGAPAVAQTEAAKPAEMKLEQGRPAGTGGEEKSMKTAAATGKRPARVNEDARHCLELPTTAEIVKCAEPYRY